MRGEPARQIAKYMTKSILPSVASRYFRGVIEDKINNHREPDNRPKNVNQDKERWNVSPTL